jgi:hypothetical protein
VVLAAAVGAAAEVIPHLASEQRVVASKVAVDV